MCCPALSWMDSRRVAVSLVARTCGQALASKLTRSAISSSSGSKYLNFGLPSTRRAYESTWSSSHSIVLVRGLDSFFGAVSTRVDAKTSSDRNVLCPIVTTLRNSLNRNDQ